MHEEKIKQFARELGFDSIRITSASALPDAGAYFKKWLKEGHGADMHYLSHDTPRRYTPEKILHNAKSVIMFGVNYFKRDHKFTDDFRIAKYAQGRDYHKVITAKLRKFSKFLAQFANHNADTSLITTSAAPRNRNFHKSAVDFGPLMERAFAAKSHLGFIGKNACIITREYGSYIFLAEIITTLELAPDPPTRWAGSCGTCTRCADICPTKAILPDRTIDSRRCISYLTIENRGAIPVGLRPKIGNWLFGCDLCQDICPHNSRAKPTRVEDFTKIPIGLHTLSLAQILSLENDAEFITLFAGTPITRAKRRGLIRNACVVAGNLLCASDECSIEHSPFQLNAELRATLLPHLKKLAQSDDAMIAEHAQWALTTSPPSNTPPSSHQGHGQSHGALYIVVPGSVDRGTS